MSRVRASLSAMAIGILLTAATVALAAPAGVKLLASWNGTSQVEALKAQAPPEAYVDNAESFAKLWKAWRGDEAVPKVDFAANLVLVCVVDGPNRVNLGPRIDDKGNLEVMGMSTLMAGPGFGYAMAVVSRAGIKTVNGLPLQLIDEPATKPATSAPATRP